VESIRGTPATEPLVPVVASVELLMLQGRVLGRSTTGDPPMLGTDDREAAFGLLGLTAPGIADWVDGVRVVVALVVPVLLAPGAVMVLGAGTDGEVEPDRKDGAVAVPVRPDAPPIADPLDNPDVPPLPTDPPVAPDDPPTPPDDAPPVPPDEDPPLDCACADKPRAATMPAARTSFRAVCDMAFSHQRNSSTSWQRAGPLSCSLWFHSGCSRVL